MSDDGGHSTGPDSVLRSPHFLAHQRLPLPEMLRFPIGDTDAETDTREPSLYDGLGDGRDAGIVSGQGIGHAASALPPHPGAGPAADVLATLLMDAKQDLDRVHWMVSVPAALFLGATAAGASAAVALWPGAGPACGLGGAAHRAYAQQAAGCCACYTAFCGLLLRVVHRVCRDLLALEGVARDFRTQLAGLALTSGAALEGHPYFRRDLHHLYSSHAKGIFLVIYIATTVVGGAGTTFFVSGAFCGDAPLAWPLRALSLASGVAAYVLPLFCFSSGGLGLGLGRRVAPAVATGRVHPAGTAFVGRRGSGSPDFGGRVAAAAASAAAGAEQHAYGLRQQEETASQGALSARHTPRAGPQRV